jgi:ParB-like chromosome segregation protein Spo0J
MLVEKIRIDCGTQSREKIDQQVVSDYAVALKEGAKFPAVVVFHDGLEYYLADGFHRYLSHVQAGRTEIEAEVKNGTLRDAILYSLSANDSHGLRRTNADKRKSVMTLLEDDEWKQWSSSDIARACKVSTVFVIKIRNALGDKPEVVKITRNGKVEERKSDRKISEVTPEVQDEKDDALQILLEENQKLTDKLTLAALPEEDRFLAEMEIEDLREELRLTKIELEAVKISRDQFQAENAQLKRQIAAMQRSKATN